MRVFIRAQGTPRSVSIAGRARTRLFLAMRRFLSPALSLLFASLAVATPEKWTEAINRFTQADAAHPPPRDGVVFVGSSSIVKWTTLEKDFPGVPVIPRGFGGSELADTVFYADRIVIPYHPRVVVVYAGDNDLAAGKTPETVLRDFQALAAKVHQALPETRLVFIGVKPSPSRWKIREQMERANRLIAAECARDRRDVFVDVWRPMLDANGEPRRELFVADMLHMNPMGYAIWTPLVAAAIK
jgi:hypothetical protein